MRVGVISNAYYNEQDGWYWCEGVIWDETAQSLITDKKWSVSCSYDFLEQDDEGGTENNIPYDREFTKLNFVHLALVDNPRYERANIVFNSKTVENEKWCTKYDKDGNPYQFKIEDGVVDLTNKFTSSPSIQDVKKYIQDLVTNGAKFATLNPDWFIDTKVNSKAKGHIIYSNEWEKMSSSEKERHNKYLIELENLLNNSEYIGEKPNLKKDTKPKIEKYHYFKTRVKIRKNIYEIVFDTEQYIGESEEKPQTVHLYNVHEINKTSVRGESNNSKNTIGSSNTSITDTTEDFNPIGENMLNNVENENWKTLYDKNGEPYHVDLDDADKTEYKVKKTTVKRKDGKEREIEYLDKPPKGWKKNEGATTAPLGYDWYTNGKSLLKGERKSILVKDHSKIYNAKEQEMALLEELKKLINNVENDKGEEMQDKDTDKKVDNADVDKREILREADAIAMKPASEFKGGAEEKFRTLTKKLEQLSYNKSSRGTADNADEDDKKDENKKSDDEEKDVDNKKKTCDNGVDNSKTDYYQRMNEIYNASTPAPKQDEYVSRADRLEAGNRY